MRREQPKLYGDFIGGIEPHFRRYRFRVVTGGKRKIHSFATREEAERHHAAFIAIHTEVKAQREELTFAGAIGEFVDHQRERGLAKEASLQVVQERLRRFFLPILEGPVRLTEDGAERLYRQLRERKGPRGTLCSVQDHHHCLSRAKALGKWLVTKKKLWRENPLAELEPIGKPKAGEESKPQLNRDSLWRLWQVCLTEGEKGDAGAAAVLCCSLLGLRASSVTNRRREHLDAHGTILKSSAKGKTVELSLMGDTPEAEEVMARLRHVLSLQARHKAPLAPLIGTGHDRWWVRRQVRRLCELAGVRVVPPHGLRGTHASLGRSLGISPGLLAGALGHSQAVQERHYATPGSVASGQVARVVGQVAGAGSTSNRSPVAPRS